MDFKLFKLKEDFRVEQVANVHFFEFSNEYSTKDDSHFFNELVFCKSGELKVRSDNYSGKLKENQMIIHIGGEKHSFYCEKNTNPTVAIIGFWSSGESLDSFSFSPTDLSENEIGVLSEIIKEGRNVFAPPYDIPTSEMRLKTDETFGAEQLLKISIEKLFLLLFRRCGLKKESSSRGFAFNVDEVFTYVKQNYKEKTTIDELAFIFGTNRSTLCKEFKAHTGESLNACYAKLKTEEAKKLLAKTDKSVSQVSDELNFSSVNYFTAFFKRRVGLTPHEYRNIKS